MTNADLSDQQLVEKLNAILASPGWVSAKGERLLELRSELIRRSLAPPIPATPGGVVVFGHGRRYAILDGELREVTTEDGR